MTTNIYVATTRLKLCDETPNDDDDELHTRAYIRVLEGRFVTGSRVTLEERVLARLGAQQLLIHIH